MRLKSAKRRFRNQWLAFEYTNEAKDEGEVIIHEKTRRALYRKLDLKKAKSKVYITFSGPLLPKNCSILFRVLM